MSDENTGLTARGPEPGNWNVHSNEDCSVHSSGGIWNVHSNDTVDVAGGKSPTHETYGQFQTAYDYLNSELFQNKLPPGLFTPPHHPGSAGPFFARPRGRPA